MNITAAVTRTGGEAFTLETLELEAPREHEVVVAISGVGLCHTDIAARDQVLPVPLPSVLGHEGSGIVTAVGSGVTKVAPGDRVVIGFNSCGECGSCGADAPAYCHQFMPLNFSGGRIDGTTPLTKGGDGVHGNFFGQSSFATHALANERNVVPVGEDVPLEIAGPLGCGLMTGAGAIINSLKVHSGSTLLILGAGPVGLAAAMAGAIQGAEHVIISEPHAARRDLTLELGATHAVDPTAGEIGELVRAIAPGGADYVFDTTGTQAVIGGAVAALAPLATVGIVAVPPSMDSLVPIPVMPPIMLGLTVRGITEGDSDPEAFIPQLLDHWRAGQFPFEKLIGTYPLSEINEACDAQARGEVVKVVLVPDAQ